MDDLSPGINFNNIIDRKNSPIVDSKKEIKNRIKELEEEEISLMREFKLARAELLPKINKIGEPKKIREKTFPQRFPIDNAYTRAFSMNYGIDMRYIPRSFSELISEDRLGVTFKKWGPEEECIIKKIVNRFDLFKRFDEYGQTLRTSFMDTSTAPRDIVDNAYDNLIDCYYTFFNSIGWSLKSKNINIQTLKLLTLLLCRRFSVGCPTGGYLDYAEDRDGNGVLKYTDSLGYTEVVDLSWLRQMVRLHVNLPMEAKEVKEFKAENGGVICVRLLLMLLPEDINFTLVTENDFDTEGWYNRA